MSLLIEKGSAPPDAGDDIEVHVLRWRRPGLRQLELLWTLAKLARGPHTSVFVRIALPAALCAILATRGSAGRVFYWQSGTVHAFDRAQPLGWSKLLHVLEVRAPFALVRRFVDRFVTGPESMVSYYRDELRVPEKKLRLLYNDIDVPRYRELSSASARARARASLGIDDDTLLLLFVHRLSPVRRTLDYLPSIFAWLAASDTTGCVLIVAGGGPDLDAAQRAALTAGVGTRVRFLGGRAQRELDPLYSAADVFVHPTYNEGFPRVLVEAMAAGLPIVSTDAGGTRDILGSQQSAFVVSRDLPQDFVAALAELVGSRELRKRLSDENATIVERYSTPVVAEMYERVLFS